MFWLRNKKIIFWLRSLISRPVAIKLSRTEAQYGSVVLNWSEENSETQQGLFQQFLEKAPGQNWEKMIDLTSKLGEIKLG